MAYQSDSKTSPSPTKHNIRILTEEDFPRIWTLWQTIFPTWPISQERLQPLLYSLPGLHYISDNGFCLSQMAGGKDGKIVALGVLPAHRGKGLGTALLEKARGGLEEAAGGELKSLKLGSETPRFWAQMPVEFSQEVKDFFLHRGFHKSSDLPARDLWKDVRNELVPPEIIDRVSKSNIKFTPLTPDLFEECITRQKALFTWSQAYEALATFNQHHEALVAIDPDTNAQIGWTLMCSPSAIMSSIHAFLPLVPSGAKTGLIAAVGIEESARGRGVGLVLVVRAMESLRARGFEGIFIDMVTLDGFYEKLGFKAYWQFEGYAHEAYRK